ncbi:YicC/YloC family endoribonuclease [Hahella sp. SMD15-11]|uniref:YicC/YloC family endoribonuclease n=1 Tax=Thermohahella caldifontis TaxID=3142973 RepID=A0AB39US43_9GAMM
MIKSMTAWARAEASNELGTATWEIRSVNHRYLEPVLRLPETLRDLEPLIRERLRGALRRGKVECTLRWQPDAAAQNFEVNMDVVENLNRAIHQVHRILDNPAHISALDILAFPGVLKTQEQDMDEVKVLVLEAFDAALAELVETRIKEGSRIEPMITSRLEKMSEIVSRVRERMPGIIERQNQALRERFEELRLEVDETRLEQELVILAQKADVAEELDRLDAHIAEVADVMRRNEAVGRRLDFLMQELNREANTLSSKSLVTETTQYAVELKVLIEQMREQVQNIE